MEAANVSSVSGANPNENPSENSSELDAREPRASGVRQQGVAADLQLFRFAGM
ncbi:hypothetical protein JQ597_36715 [Bradyrhizobium sp. AUGA SZCCT0177]|uniref:hypothetical protein n=1 Tax=Bradyrhizobium sp. AUGA SZCCT0177 TaxID=2807665 RepID=UPI001BADFF3F|nr:hypothetical protein [Bradyrhizobium sp. AUGA SZCCT0177]MBR1287609.1 hypothetical protein [Bradyrhizobium sp. AUGA SZCCT0177]